MSEIIAVYILIFRFMALRDKCKCFVTLRSGIHLYHRGAVIVNAEAFQDDLDTPDYCDDGDRERALKTVKFEYHSLSAPPTA